MSIEKITEDKIKEIQERREIIKVCQSILEKELSQHGIKLNPICMEGFDENERPFNYVKPENENPKLFLGDEHHVLFTFEIEDGVIAVVDRYLEYFKYVKAPSNRLDKVVESFSFDTIVAAGTDGKDVYYMVKSGAIYRIDDPEKTCIERSIPVCQRIWSEFFTEEQIDAAAAEYCVPGCNYYIGNEMYYDPSKQTASKYVTTGNYYHGYEKEFVEISRDGVLYTHIKENLEIYDLLKECQEGKIPLLSIILKLPFKE